MKIVVNISVLFDLKKYVKNYTLYIKNYQLLTFLLRDELGELKYINFMLFFVKYLVCHLWHTKSILIFVSKTTHQNAQFLYHYIDIIIHTIYGDAVVIGLISKKTERIINI